jgi:peptidoglycan/LPS O-acetylase OafA/YrhL
MSASMSGGPVEETGAGASNDRSPQIAVLTGLRGFAALMVVLIHTSGHTGYPWLGVKGFGPISLFVLSGFLLYRPWARWMLRLGRRPSVRSFAIRRLCRIFPAYLVVLLVVAAVYPPSTPNGLEGWLRGLTLTGIYASDGLRPGMEQTWSLGTELSWYVALPLLAVLPPLVVRRRSPRQAYWLTFAMLSLSLPVSAAWVWWVEVNHLGIYFTYSFWLPGSLFCFSSGALVALLVEGSQAGIVNVSRLHFVTHHWFLMLIALAAVAVGSSSLSGPDLYVPATFGERQVRTGCALVLAVSLLLLAVFGDLKSPVNRLMGSRGAVATGRWSYGIYLWHLPVIAVLFTDFTFPAGVPGLILALAVVLTISVTLSAATFAWVERPAMDWSHRRTRSPRHIANVASQAVPRAQITSARTTALSTAASGAPADAG